MLHLHCYPQLFYPHTAPLAPVELLCAIGELGDGPWTDLGGAVSDDLGMSFTSACTVLDRMLDRLEHLTPGFGARIATARARARLDPRHPTRLPD